jgi:hypothetical protein
MILLRHDCLVFEDQAGNASPGSVHEVTLELISQSPESLDQETIQHAAQAVLHYFKEEKKQTTVTMDEFCAALEQALGGLGLPGCQVQAHTSLKPHHPGPAAAGAAGSSPPKSSAKTAAQLVETDLRALAGAETPACELLFYPRLRTVVRCGLRSRPVVLRFHGLRQCVKQLVGAKRWTRQCQVLQDQIVEYLRTCLDNESRKEGCVLVVE